MSIKLFKGKIFWVNNDFNSELPLAKCDRHYTRIEDLIFDKDSSFIQFTIPQINGLERSYNNIVLHRKTIGNGFNYIDDGLSINGEIFESQDGNSFIVYGTWQESDYSHSFSIIIESELI